MIYKQNKEKDIRIPEWLKISRQNTAQYGKTHTLLSANCLHTICESGRCPNQCECWNRGTATFMILGDICTRGCKFCNTLTGKPLPPDADEPQKLAATVKAMNLKHTVLTSVTRDDLPDGGAQHWYDCICAIRMENPHTTIEVLIPDFNGKTDLIQKVIDAQPNIISHNMETVRRLTPLVRSKATYVVSLNVLRYISSCGVTAKTGIMVGLGETEDEVIQLMDDTLLAGCSILTIGQYLRPSKKNIAVSEYITPQQFDKYKLLGLQKGFRCVESAPLVRSSYHAEEQV